jgi:hypothetical protein
VEMRLIIGNRCEVILTAPKDRTVASAPPVPTIPAPPSHLAGRKNTRRPSAMRFTHTSARSNR